jgi:hypothetical protein
MTVLIVPDRGLPDGGRDRVTGKSAWGARVLMARGSTPIPASAIRIKSARSPSSALGTPTAYHSIHDDRTQVVHYLSRWPRSTKQSNNERPARGHHPAPEHGVAEEK